MYNVYFVEVGACLLLPDCSASVSLRAAVGKCHRHCNL